MAAKSKENITVAIPKGEEKPEEIRVRIMLPKRESDDNPGVTVDQYEHVTISNEQGEQNVRVKRGEWVDVTIPVFMQLKNRYPNI
jgi:hypothetical protein